MKKRYLILSLILTLFISAGVGYSSWISSPQMDETTGEIDHDESKNEMVTLNVHYRAQTNDVVTTTEYFVPQTFTISHGVTCYDANGNTSTTDMSKASVTKVEDNDALQVYYDVVDGAYTTINCRTNMKGPEQINSLKVDVSGWSAVSSGDSYAAVWDTSVTNASGKSERLRFTSDSGNVATHSHQYSVGDVCVSETQISSSTVTTENKTVTEIVYQRCTVTELKQVTYGYSTVSVGCTTSDVDYANFCFYTQFEQRMVRITETRGGYTDVGDVATVNVKKGSLITPFDLNVQDYTNYGYFSDADFTTFFDFSTPVTESGNIYLRYIENGDSILANSVSSLTSGGTLNLYDQYRGGSGSGTDISSDPTYYNTTNSVFLDGCTVASGATLNLTYGAEELYISPNTGEVEDSTGSHRSSTDNSLALDYDGSTEIGDDNCSCYVILNGDLTVKGTLNIGAEVGGYSASSSYSFIIGRYAMIDLHGHTLTVDGGTLNAYGLIKDSVGGGKIIVKNSGKVQTTFTVSDGRGRDQTALGVTKRQTPFTEYRLSYLQVPTYFYYGTSCIGYLKMDFQELGICNVYLNVLGTTFNDAMLSWADSESSNDYILYEPYQIEELSTPANSTIYKNMYNWRNRIEIHANIRQASSIILTATVNSMDIDIDFARIDFPISPFWDLVLSDGYTFEINSKMTFYPGSSFYAESGSTVSFKYAGEKTYDEISKSFLGFGITLPGETRYVAGGIMSYTSNIRDLATNTRRSFGVGVYNQTTYWNYVKPGNAIIDGDMSFDAGIDTSKDEGFYYLSGPIALSDSALSALKSNASYLKTYDMKAELYGGFLYNRDNYSVSSQYELATSYNINPLISSNVSYLYDSSHSLEGTYNTSTGVFTASNGTSYFLKADTDMYVDGSSGSNQSSKIDRALTITQIDTAFEDYRIVKDTSGSYYAYYCGIHIPVESSSLPGDSNINSSTFVNNYEIKANIRKFMSNSEATQEIDIKKYVNESDKSNTLESTIEDVNVASWYDSVYIKYSTSSKAWSFSCFESGGTKYTRIDTNVEGESFYSY